MTEIHVRKLKTKDLWTAINLVKPYLDIDEIRSLYNARPNPDSYGLEKADEYQKARQLYAQSITAYVVNAFADIITEDGFRKWLADLAGMSQKEFDDSDMETSFVVIAELIENNDLPDFFSRVSNMIGKTFGNKLMQSNSVTVG